jgi:hypothetical protein
MASALLEVDELFQESQHGIELLDLISVWERGGKKQTKRDGCVCERHAHLLLVAN